MSTGDIKDCERGEMASSCVQSREFQNVMSRSTLHVMLDALQRLGHPMDGYKRSPHTREPEILRYLGDRPGTYTGYTEANDIARGMRFGPATMEYDNGDKYDGRWDRDHFDGQGTFSKKNRIGVGYVWQFEGIFSQDKPVSGTQRTDRVTVLGLVCEKMIERLVRY
jgi:hypothetical protein